MSLLLLPLPALVLVVVFCYFPMWGIVIAFKDYKMARGILAVNGWVFIILKRYFPIRIFTGYWGIRLKIQHTDPGYVFSGYNLLCPACK